MNATTKPADVTTKGLSDFNATEVMFSAETPKARTEFSHWFGAGAVSVNLRKSDSGAFVYAMAACGLCVAEQS